MNASFTEDAIISNGSNLNFNDGGNIFTNTSNIFFDEYDFNFDIFFNFTANDASINASNSTQSPTTLERPNYYVIDPFLLLQIGYYVDVVCIPTVSIIGIVGNVFSLWLLVSDGMKKSSNVLLIALTMSDMIFVTTLLITTLCLEFGSVLMHTYDETVNYALFSLWMIVHIIIRNVSLLTSMSIPILITLERLCAIYFPLKFHLIVTPKRCLLAVGLFVLLYTARCIIEAISFTLHGPIYVRGKFVMVTVFSQIGWKLRQERKVMNEIINQLTGTFAITVLIVGSVIIAYKVKMAARRRAQMMSQGMKDADGNKKNASQSRTTKTLLTVCVTFTLLSGIVYVYDQFNNLNHRITHFGDKLKMLVIDINCSVNFFIYVFSNDKYKKRMVALMDGLSTKFQAIMPACLRPGK